MFDYYLLVMAHLLLFVYWLGADFGVFYSTRYVTDPSLSIEARLTASRILLALDQLPRVCLLLMLPVGFTLAARLGIVPLGDALLAAIWLAALLWVASVITQHVRHGRPPTQLLARIDLPLRVALALGLAGVGLLSLLGDGPVTAGWLAAKLLVFGIIVAAGLGIRIVFAPFGPAFARLLAEGSSPEVEAVIQRSLARSKPFVLIIWAGILAAAWLGLTKPPL